MTRMDRRKNVYTPQQDQYHNEQIEQQRHYDEQPVPEQYEQQEQQMQQQQPQHYQQPQQQAPDESGFGDSRDPTIIAKSVERNPTPPGICQMLIGGRPIDLHDFEDYLVWKVSPYQIRTLLRYHNARTIEELKNYSLRPTMKMKSGTMILIVIAILFLVGGLAVFMFMPELTAMFKGFV